MAQKETTTAPAPEAAPPAFKRTKQVTIDALSFKTRERAYVRFLGEMHKSEKADEADDKREPATVARVLNLEDGHEYRLICPALLVSAILEEGVEYVGHCFEINVSRDPKPGKRYKEVEVYEIECPAA